MNRSESARKISEQILRRAPARGVTRKAAGRAGFMNRGTVHVRPLDQWSTRMWYTLWDELREAVWLASVIGALSIVGVGLAVVLAAA